MPDHRVLTREGFNKLQDELKRLETTDKPAAVERLRKAREMGSLNDNPEYDAARESLAKLGARILEIDETLKQADVISRKKNKASGKANVGSVVVIEIDGEKDTYVLVDSAEADPAQGRISVESPVGKALLGNRSGDKVEVNLPQVKLKYKILGVDL